MSALLDRLNDFEDQEQIEGTVVLDGYDEACVGITENGQLVYIYEDMIAELARQQAEEGWTEDDAREWVDYNTLRSLDYLNDGKKPIIAYKIP